MVTNMISCYKLTAIKLFHPMKLSDKKKNYNPKHKNKSHF